MIIPKRMIQIASRQYDIHVYLHTNTRNSDMYCLTFPNSAQQKSLRARGERMLSAWPRRTPRPAPVSANSWSRRARVLARQEWVRQPARPLTAMLCGIFAGNSWYRMYQLEKYCGECCFTWFFSTSCLSVMTITHYEVDGTNSSSWFQLQGIHCEHRPTSMISGCQVVLIE